MPDTPTFYLIPHTHWEGAVFQTREAYLDLGLRHLVRALALLDAYPHYRFTLDQACYVKPFLERYPEQAEVFRRFVREGRLAIVGGTDTMLDVNLPGGECWVRQVLYGKGYFRRALGCEVTVGWQLDTFGHHAQLPQLLKLSGLHSLWFFRGVPAWETPAEFLWEGLDGTQIPAYWLPLGYAVTYGSPATAPEFGEFMEDRYEQLGRFSGGPLRVGPGGADVCPPEEHLPELVARYNRCPGARLHLQLATPAEYEAARALDATAPVVSGEFNPIFQGAYSSRIELKQQARELETLLLTAEQLGAQLQALGHHCSDGGLGEAWERVLFNEAHDLMAGVMTDTVYEDTRQTYDLARRLGEGELHRRLGNYCTSVDTRYPTPAGAPPAAQAAPAVPLVVYNPLGFTRTDPVRVAVSFGRCGVRAAAVVDGEGRPVPAQLLREERAVGGDLVEAELVFIARDVPALGHAVYQVLPTEPGAAAAAVAGTPLNCGVLESALYRLTVDPLTGAVTGLACKADGREVLAAPGNLVVQEPDHGDLWEPYRPLDGGSRIAMRERHPLPPRGAAVYSDEQTGEPGCGLAGPVMSEFTVRHPFASGTLSTTVRLYADLPRVEFCTRLLNQDEFVRYRVAFPAAVEGGEAVHEIPFGALARPEGIEFPAQNWVDLSDGRQGLALLNRGLPGNAVHGGTLVLSLLRSTRIVAYGYGGGYGPGMSSDTGLALGQEFTFQYALLPHAGDWRQAAVYREGLQFRTPLLVRTAAPHDGPLAPRQGYLTVTPDNVVVSAVKPTEDGAVVVRVYEATGREARAALRLPAGTSRVEEVNLLEDVLVELPCAGELLELDLGPFEIRSLRLSAGSRA